VIPRTHLTKDGVLYGALHALVLININYVERQYILYYTPNRTVSAFCFIHHVSRWPLWKAAGTNWLCICSLHHSKHCTMLVWLFSSTYEYAGQFHNCQVMSGDDTHHCKSVCIRFSSCAIPWFQSFWWVSQSVLDESAKLFGKTCREIACDLSHNSLGDMSLKQHLCQQLLESVAVHLLGDDQWRVLRLLMRRCLLMVPSHHSEVVDEGQADIIPWGMWGHF